MTGLGRIPESELVTRVSQLDVTAGYDIASFDGDRPTIMHNRFIEVKASRQHRIRFFWSANEYEKAKVLGDQYWIYFLGNYDGKIHLNIEPVMIQNPIRRIETYSEFTLKATKYVVERIGD